MKDIKKRFKELTKDDFEFAFNTYESVKEKFPTSRYYDIEFQSKRYPPKPIIAIAYKKHFGEDIETKDFNEGKGSLEFKLIQKFGFQLVEKKVQQAIIFYIQEGSKSNAEILFSSDKKKFYWNDEHFINLNENDHVFIVNTFLKKVFFTTFNFEKIPANLDGDKLTASFSVNNDLFSPKATNLNQLNSWKNFNEFNILNSFDIPDNWKWIGMGSGATTFILGPKVNQEIAGKNLQRIELLSSLSDNKEYQNVLNACKIFLGGRKRESLIDLFVKVAENQNLYFPTFLAKRYIASLSTKPFVIFTGLSGSGKTKLAQTFAKWICESEEQYKIIPVGADWTNREPLLGYPNSLDPKNYVLPDNGALGLVIEAAENAKGKNLEECNPYFLILDEMNLSHVERYFADFLSAMESKEEIMLYSGEKRTASNGLEIPHKIKLPPNLFIVGTVNIDETTYMFSPKVLDRANTIEFRLDEEDISSFFTTQIVLNPIPMEGQGSVYAEELMQLVAKDFSEKSKEASSLLAFFGELQKLGAEFGYRTASEMKRLMHQLENLGMDTSQKESALDVAVMQKMLPKLHGSRSKLVKVLPILASFCLRDNNLEKAKQLLDSYKNDRQLKKEQNEEVVLPLSFTKIARMYTNAIENGFANYAEG